MENSYEYLRSTGKVGQQAEANERSSLFTACSVVCQPISKWYFSYGANHLLFHALFCNPIHNVTSEWACQIRNSRVMARYSDWDHVRLGLFDKADSLPIIWWMQPGNGKARVKYIQKIESKSRNTRDDIWNYNPTSWWGLPAGSIGDAKSY
jgi:hypothetical protein